MVSRGSCLPLSATSKAVFPYDQDGERTQRPHMTNGGDVEGDLDRLRCVTVALSRGGQFLPKREFVGVSGVGS